MPLVYWRVDCGDSALCRWVSPSTIQPDPNTQSFIFGGEAGDGVIWLFVAVPHNKLELSNTLTLLFYLMWSHIQ